MECKFCEKVCKNDNSLRNHERLCKKNPERKVPKKTKKWFEAMNKRKGTNGKNQFTKAKELGKVFEVTDETKKKLSDAGKGYKWTEERKKKHSDSMKKAVKENPDSYTKNNVCGRVKNIEYKGVVLKGQWELKTAQWLDSNNIAWDYEPQGFVYIWNETERIYYPDFYLKEFDLYVEVKGYKTDRDVAKWKSLGDKLKIIDKNVINKLNEMDIEDLIG